MQYLVRDAILENTPNKGEYLYVPGVSADHRLARLRLPPREAETGAAAAGLSSLITRHERTRAARQLVVCGASHVRSVPCTHNRQLRGSGQNLPHQIDQSTAERPWRIRTVCASVPTRRHHQPLRATKPCTKTHRHPTPHELM